MNDKIVLGVDIGGSHITAALVDVSLGKIVTGSFQRAKIDSAADADTIIRNWCSVMDISLQFSGNSGRVAVAMPGPFDYAAGISYMKAMGKYDSLYGMDVRKLIKAQLHENVVDVSFINDAGCFLQGELSHGLAAAHKNVVGFTLGTGFGSAIGEQGKALDADYWCYPFMGGICEDVFSSRWFVKQYNTYSGLSMNNVKELIDEVEFAGPLLQVFDEFSVNMSVFLTMLYRKYHFDCVVFGGNIANAASLFLPQLKYHLHTMAIIVPVYISSKGETAALIGAACSIEV